MTIDDPHDDELVAAVLDGEADAHTRALVAGTPRLAARLQEFRALHTVLADVGDDDLTAGTERRIAAALSAAEDIADEQDDDPVGDPSDPAVMAPPVRRPRRLPALLAAAAAVLVVVVGIVVVQDHDGRRTTTAADSAPPTTVTTPSTTVAAATGSTREDLGSFGDAAALRDHLTRPGTAFGEAASEPLTTVPGADAAQSASACADSLASQHATIVGVATVAGRKVVVGRMSDGRTVVLDASSCTPLP